ncbi:efflux RND transporter periplasmic adaptor subunit [Faecalibacter bovis]|uniref:Efflux RND transporter periplasmic adaptor subunit n=1 Tax=Faecalibacter bovis TaxID=2898187 RepID=A0ABX7XB29_9FLAO|nr:efflux RND transporter periplasmic adaptor subunit [Faecalibacter bovis]QTV05100.1 efflux RND transporter periplasmic adaptor subunit [Faecalibacter bovis]
MKLVKTLLWIVAAIALLGGGYYIITKNKAKQDEEVAIVASKIEEITVNTAKLEYKDLSADFSVNGNFEPIQEMTFPSEMSGRIVRVLVDEGDYVRVGQTLATIKKDAIEIDMSQAQNNLQNAIIDNQRYENAYKTGGVTKQQVDHSRLQLKNARAAVEAQGVRVRDTNVKATIAGIVNKRYIEPGSVVNPGAQMFDIVNVSRLKLKVSVNESEIVNLRIGQNVKVTASVLPDDEFVGKITFIAPKADASLSFPVEIEVSNNNKLKAGMYGTAVFSTSEDPTVTKALPVIPAKAFVNGVSSNTVFVVENGVSKLTKVVSGRVVGDYVEILSGLKQSAEVVTAGQINLTDGEKVKVVK